MIQLQKAKRTMARIRVALGGTSGSGKTMSSLLLAYGLMKAAYPELSDAELWEKICIIDTENGSASLYVNMSVGPNRIGEYYTIPMGPPYEASKYIDSIHAAEQAGIEVIIIDSLSHAWIGEGGALDKQGKIAARTGNSYTAWRDVTPEHNRLVDTMLQSSAHIIANIRAKTEYTQEKNANGKTVVKNIGMGLQMRDGVDFEFSTVFMLDADHVANATKDRTGLFDGKFFVITPETGKEIHQWLASGAPEKPAVPEIKKAEPEAVTKPEENTSVTMEMVDKAIKAKCVGASAEDKRKVAEDVKSITGGVANYLSVTDPKVLQALYDKFKS